MASSGSSTCIYCTTKKPLSEFSREHVVPDAFRPDGGSGWRQNLTLPGSQGVVCVACNQHFGDTIDLALTRDSYEAFLRLTHHAKDPAEVEDLFRSRVFITLPSGERLGPLKVRFGPPEAGEVGPRLKLQPQIRVRDRAGNHVCVLEDELDRLTDDADLDTSSIALFCNSDEEQDRLMASLDSLGLAPKTWSEVEGLPEAGEREVNVDLAATFDQTVARCIAKIGFNYLTWHVGPGYALSAGFDDIRAFIRYGTGSWRDFVRHRKDPILGRDTERVRSTQGHLVALTNSGPRTTVRVAVSLYNERTYEVTLSPTTPGIWRPIRSGHHYDIKTGEVREILHTSLHVPAPPQYPVF